MRRTFILGAVGAIALTIGLGVSATLASGATPPVPPSDSTSMMDTDVMAGMMTGNGMANLMGTDVMVGMMTSDGMANMMDTDGMGVMHATMHDALSGSVPSDVLAACDTAHAAMSIGASSPLSVGDAHAAHHTGAHP